MPDSVLIPDTRDLIPDASEGDTETDLANALLGLPEVARKGGRLHERRERRARRAQSSRSQRNERILRVQKVEYFRNRFDARRPGELEAAAETQIQL